MLRWSTIHQTRTYQNHRTIPKTHEQRSNSTWQYNPLHQTRWTYQPPSIVYQPPPDFHSCAKPRNTHTAALSVISPPKLTRTTLIYHLAPFTVHVGCIYAPYKVNTNIFQFYFDFLDIFHHTSMHPLFRNKYEFYLIFCDFISSSIIYNNYLYSRQHFPYWFHLAPDLLILSCASCPELKSRPCMRS